jgi:hypothetical protein
MLVLCRFDSNQTARLGGVACDTKYKPFRTV